VPAKLAIIAILSPQQQLSLSAIRVPSIDVNRHKMASIFQVNKSLDNNGFDRLPFTSNDATNNKPDRN